MADEISATFGLTITNGNLLEKITQAVYTVDQSFAGRGGHVQWIGTSEEVIDVGDIGVGSVMTEGYCFLKNVEDSGGNFVTIGPESSGAMVGFMRLNPGEIAYLRIEPDTIMRAQADTGDVRLDVNLYAN